MILFTWFQIRAVATNEREEKLQLSLVFKSVLHGLKRYVSRGMWDVLKMLSLVLSLICFEISALSALCASVLSPIRGGWARVPRPFPRPVSCEEMGIKYSKINLISVVAKKN